MKNIIVWYSTVRHLICTLLIVCGLIVFGSLKIILSNNGILSYNANNVWYGVALVSIGIVGLIINIFLIFKKHYDNSVPIKMIDRFKKAIFLDKSKVDDGDNTSREKKRTGLLLTVSIVLLVAVGVGIGVLLAVLENYNDVIYFAAAVIYFIVSVSALIIYDHICYVKYMKVKDNDETVQ